MEKFVPQQVPQHFVAYDLRVRSVKTTYDDSPLATLLAMRDNVVIAEEMPQLTGTPVDDRGRVVEQHAELGWKKLSASIDHLID
jgi:hypothetical protein